jgi:cell division septum initiation protein DivIVA
MTATKDIIDSIENRLSQLNEEIGALNAARDALDGDDTQAPRRRRGAATSRTRSGPSDNAGGASAVRATVEPGEPGSTIASRRSPSTPRKPARRRARAKADRTVKVVRAGKLELLLSDTGGLATSALAQRANADRDQVLTLLRELEMAGRVRRMGQRRATRWRAITDEERIRERAAELAARSSSAA